MISGNELFLAKRRESGSEVGGFEEMTSLIDQVSAGDIVRGRPRLYDRRLVGQKKRDRPHGEKRMKRIIVFAWEFFLAAFESAAEVTFGDMLDWP